MSEIECHARGPWTEREGEMTDESTKECSTQKRGLDDGAGVGGCGGCRWIEGVRKKEIQGKEKEGSVEEGG